MLHHIAVNVAQLRRSHERADALDLILQGFVGEDLHVAFFLFVKKYLRKGGKGHAAFRQGLQLACVGVNVSKEGFRLLFRFEEPHFLLAPAVGNGCPLRRFSAFDIGDAPAALFSALHTDTSFLGSIVPRYEVCANENVTLLSRYSFEKRAKICENSQKAESQKI